MIRWILLIFLMIVDGLGLIAINGIIKEQDETVLFKMIEIVAMLAIACGVIITCAALWVPFGIILAGAIGVIEVFLIFVMRTDLM